MVVQKYVLEVSVQRDAKANFPYDDPNAELMTVWTALLALIMGGARDARVRVGTVDAKCHTKGIEEDVEEGDN